MQAQDKLLVVLSQASVASSWVRREVEIARRMETEKNSTVLFPLRIDDAVLEASDPDSKLIRERLIADFRGWTDQQGVVLILVSLPRGRPCGAGVE